MLSLSYIQGIDDDAVSLLKSVGVEDATQLSEHTAASLANLLNEAGTGKLPPIDSLEDWISQAGLITGTLSGSKDSESAEIVEAVELDEAELEAEVIALDDDDEDDEDLEDIPEVVILEEDEDQGGIDVVELPDKSYHKNDELAYWRKVRGLDKDFGGAEGDPDDVWKDVNPSSFNSFNDYREGNVGVKPLVDEDDTEEFARIKRMKHRVDDKDAKPDFGDKGNISRWVRRGVQHPAPFLVWITGLFVVIARLYVLALIIFLPFAVIEKGNQFKEDARPGDEAAATEGVTAGAFSPGAILDDWWWLMFGILIFVGWLYLWSVLRVRCRVCSCQLYYSSRAYKHVKAHRLRPMGYVFALGLHAVIFRWFRCMYCGTAIRLQESAHTQKEQTIDAPAIEVEDQEEGAFKEI